MEVWKDVKGFGGTFQVSNFGRIKTFNYRNSGKEMILKPKKHNKGYLQVQLIKGNINKTYTIHRLVAEAFIPNPNNYPCVNHKDEDKTNNNADNLEWCDSKYNVRYSMNLHPERKLKPRNYVKNIGRLDMQIDQFDLNGNFVMRWKNSRTIFLETGMSDWSISECCRGNRRTAYGYVWRYAD